MYDIESILYDIKNERCILIVGPDLINFDGKTLFEIFCHELVENNSDKLQTQHIFEKEELLLLSKNTKETAFRTLLEQFYEKQNCYNSPFDKISQIPFHLIISLFPDKRLCQIFENQKYDYQFSHFPIESNPLPLEKPSKSCPLIYNLLGNLEEGDILITFDHLFTYLSGIMGRRELPKTLQEALKKAGTFIFLGVRFERWYMQLLLKIITQGDKAYNLTFLNNTNRNDIGTFIAKRLDLEFFDIEPIEFLDTLYNECNRQQLLKRKEKQTNSKVFISYSHKDKLVVQKIHDFLIEADIEVVIDEHSMTGGQKIADFVNKIKDVKCVLAVISQNSMLSPWVIKEMSITLSENSKYFLPCYLDNTFMNNDFSSSIAEKYVDEILIKIDKEIAQRGKASTEDLTSEREIWVNYWQSLPSVIYELKKVKCISLENESFDKGIKQVIQNIIKLL